MKKSFFFHKSLLKSIADLFIWGGATIFAFALRFDGDLSKYESQLYWLIVSLLPIKALLIWAIGSYRQSWRNIGFIDLFQIALMVGLLSLPYVSVLFFGQTLFKVPLSVSIIESLLVLLGLFAIRAVTRFFMKYSIPLVHRKYERKRVFLAGLS